MRTLKVLSLDDIEKDLKGGMNVLAITKKHEGCILVTAKKAYRVSRYSMYKIVNKHFPELVKKVRKGEVRKAGPEPSTFLEFCNEMRFIVREEMRSAVNELISKPLVATKTKVVPYQPQKMFICQSCGAMFSKIGGLHRHIAMKHERRAWQFKKSPEEVKAYMDKIRAMKGK